MGLTIDFNPVAFDHGASEADIRKARHSFGMTMTQAIYDGFLDEPSDDDAQDKYLLIGFDCNANPLEIMYNFITDYHVNVFHAMSCRSIYHHLLYL
jgi:hypothetical protein